MRQRRYVLRKCAQVIDVGCLGLGLGIADTTLRAVVAANAASALGEVGVVKQKYRKRIGLDSQPADQRRDLRVKPVDIDLCRGKPERTASLAKRAGRAEALFCQHNRT